MLIPDFVGSIFGDSSFIDCSTFAFNSDIESVLVLGVVPVVVDPVLVGVPHQSKESISLSASFFVRSLKSSL